MTLHVKQRLLVVLERLCVELAVCGRALYCTRPVCVRLVNWTPWSEMRAAESKQGTMLHTPKVFFDIMILVIKQIKVNPEKYQIG